MTLNFNDFQKQDLKFDINKLQTAYNEILYADDTILITENSEDMEKLLQTIEKEGEKYGMKLNQEKCEMVARSETQ